MKREIKFRAWDGKRMYEWKESGVVENEGQWEFNAYEREVRTGGGVTLTCHVKYWGDNLIKMQYTGLKDKNGKEIYEGDICSWTYGAMSGKSKISFYDGAFHLSDYPFEEHTQLQTGERVEVIGNIYENPGLIK